jgi:hypothetical protein
MAHLADSVTTNRLVMVGVIHRDKEGSALLSSFLGATKPDMVSVEFSEFGLSFRLTKGELFRRRVNDALDEFGRLDRPVTQEALDQLLAFIDPPLEYVTAAEYCRNHGARLLLADLDFYSSLRLRQADQLFSRENLAKLLSMSHREEKGAEKALARLFFEKGVKAFPYTNEMYTRDWYMRDRIATIARGWKNLRMVHICGWQHLSDPHDLYKPLNPTKVFIHDPTLCF